MNVYWRNGRVCSSNSRGHVLLHLDGVRARRERFLERGQCARTGRGERSPCPRPGRTRPGSPRVRSLPAPTRSDTICSTPRTCWMAALERRGQERLHRLGRRPTPGGPDGELRQPGVRQELDGDVAPGGQTRAGRPQRRPSRRPPDASGSAGSRSGLARETDRLVRAGSGARGSERHRTRSMLW